MRKKLFAILMSAMMMVTFMPSMAFAAEGEPKPISTKDANHDCSVDTNYDSVETVLVAGACDSAPIMKWTCNVCGDWTIGYSDDKPDHSYVVEDLDTYEFEDAAEDAVATWLQNLLANTETLDGSVEQIAKWLVGVTPTDDERAQEVKEQIMATIGAFLEKSKGNDNNAVTGMIAAVQNLVGNYIDSLDETIGVAKETAAEAEKELAPAGCDSACHFLVKHCKNCVNVAQIEAYGHVAPANIPDCANTYVCEECGKTVFVDETKKSHYEQDAEKIRAAIDAAWDGDKDKAERGQTPINWDGLSVLINELYFSDTTGHDYAVEKVETACGIVYTVTCSKCGDSKSFVLPTSLTKHNFTWKTLLPATCMNDDEVAQNGLEVQVCADCGTVNMLSLREIPWQHNYVEKTYAPTCGLPGFTVQECTGCGNMIPATIKDIVPATGHDSVVERLVEPGCGGSNGLLKISCKNCDLEGYYMHDTKIGEVAFNVSSLGDIEKSAEKIKEYIAADAWSGIVKVMDKLHSPKNAETGEYEEGKEIYKYYFVGYALEHADNPIELKSIDGAGHDFSTWEIVSAPTCEDGTTWAPKCTKCNTFAHGATTGATKVPTVVSGDALGHTSVTVEVPATCGAKAYHYNYCTVCHKYLDDKGVALVTQEFDNAKNVGTDATSTPFVAPGAKCTPSGEWVTVKDSTFLTPGTRVQYCTVCHGVCKYDDVQLKNLKKAYNLTLKAGKKSFTAKTRVATKYAEGYQIAWKVKGANNFKYKKFEANANGKINKTIKNLKSGKKYTVKVRAYAWRNGVIQYGAWSDKKFVTVK